jgi:hypothetical protein
LARRLSAALKNCSCVGSTFIAQVPSAGGRRGRQPKPERR